MEETTATTLEKIQDAAMEEFLDKGFLGARRLYLPLL